MAVPRDTLLHKEIFLTDEVDDNSLKTIMMPVQVLGEHEYECYMRVGDADQARSSHSRRGSRKDSGDSATDTAGALSSGADSGDEEFQSEGPLLCRFRYDVQEMTTTPIGSTASALQGAAFGMPHEEKIAAHIRDFQIKWIACLRHFGHYVSVGVSVLRSVCAVE